MADIRILLDEQQQLTFDVEVQGVSSSRIQPRFIIETDAMDISFHGKMIDNVVTVDLPILSKTLETTEYNCRLEFVVEGEKFFTPMEATLEAVLPVKVRAGINSNTVVESKSNISVSSVKINKPKVSTKPKKATRTVTESKTQLNEAKFIKGSRKLIESAITMLEDLPDFGDPGAGMAGRTATTKRTNAIWKKLNRPYKTMSPPGKEQMQSQLQKLAETAQDKGIQLPPKV